MKSIKVSRSNLLGHNDDLFLICKIRRIIKLDVPSYKQTENYTCVPSCCKMMLDYLNHEKLKIQESDLDESQIAKIMNTTLSGTVFFLKLRT